MSNFEHNGKVYQLVQVPDLVHEGKTVCHGCAFEGDTDPCHSAPSCITFDHDDTLGVFKEVE
ncbi:hypothetical protein X534_gp21 [Ralstonia phage RSB3]|uniref:Uncharacterized protein n=1 Tax=Ralstonia phage RSB3 TaxID=1402875 RepID=U3TFM0_9CAUD|nr:hypothetical protein X534_gp21 [Ralstonia phage RSB3]BAN92332.1 hypothetical protein [Ralstonia phage RSB3]